MSNGDRSTAARGGLQALTALRFVAAAMVFLGHTPLTIALSSTFELASSGVAFFFVLSGFILTYAYHDRLSTGITRAAVRSFYIARFARIYPLYILTLATVLAIEIPTRTVDWSRLPTILVAETAMVQSWFPDIRIYQGLNSPEWSLSVEAFFYALFPFVLGFALRLFRAASALTVALTAATIWVAGGLATVALPSARVDWMLYVFPPARLMDFCIGILVAIAWRKAQPRPVRYPTLLETLAVIGVVATLAIVPAVPLSERHALIFTPCFAVLIFVFAGNHGAISQALATPIAVRLGEISFAFYLVQWTALRLGDVMHVWDRPWGFCVAFGIEFGFTTLLSFALFHWFELPMRAHVRAAFERHRARSAFRQRASPQPSR